MKFSNEKLYKLREGWLQILDRVEQLNNLTPQQLEFYDIKPTSDGDYLYATSGKFVDDWYKYLFIKEQNSRDPLDHEEIEVLKKETMQLFNDACQFMYGRNCVFTYPYSAYNSNNYAERQRYPDITHCLETAIEKATDAITPEYGFYKKPGRYPTDLIIKKLDKDIERCKGNILSHEASISTIGYEHYDDTELGIEIDYDVNEKYKPHEDAIKHLKESIALLESFKAKLAADENQEEIQNQQGVVATNNNKVIKKKSIFKRILDKLKRKRQTTNTAENNTNPSTEDTIVDEESTNTQHPGGAWHSDW